MTVDCDKKERKSKGKKKKDGKKGQDKVYCISILLENNKIFFKTLLLFQIILFSLATTSDYDSLIF